MLDKLKQLGDLKKMRDQAMKIQKQLAQEEIVVEEGDIRVVISGDQKLKEFTVKGHSSEVAIEALNKAIKQSQELAAKKLQEMSGGLGGLMGGGGQE
ncbi:YbaB/EbfC family nucleoid-associated protein [Patescibacteria group bacterium]|nr:YbaB/EbfC family nucleoid-associated protein [Patescibacteria group bacterium]